MKRSTKAAAPFAALVIEDSSFDGGGRADARFSGLRVPVSRETVEGHGVRPFHVKRWSLAEAVVRRVQSAGAMSAITPASAARTLFA